MDNLKEFFKDARLLLYALLTIIVSMGCVYASIYSAKLNSIDPAVYDKQGIYWVAGLINAVVASVIIAKGVSKDKEDK